MWALAASPPHPQTAVRDHFCRFFLERMNPSFSRSVIVIPCDTANPLNSFLKSGLTLKFSVLFSLSVAPSAAGRSLWLLTNRYPSMRDRTARSHDVAQNYRFPPFWQARKPET